MLLGKSKAGGNTSMLQWNFQEGCAILKHFLQGYGKKSWKFQGNSFLLYNAYTPRADNKCNLLLLTCCIAAPSA